MSKRYAYFRTETGRPYKGRDAKNAPTHVLAEIGRKSRLVPNAGIQWDQFFMERFEIALRSAIVIMGPDEKELNELDASPIISQAIVAVLEKTPSVPIDPLGFLTQADQLAAAFYHQPLQKYVMISSLSIEGLPTKRMLVRDCTILALKRRGKRWPLPEMLRLYADATPYAEHFASTTYCHVKVATEGRSVHDAIDTALNALHLLRGIWSLIATRGSWTFHIGGTSPKKPIGIIHTGPVHTLHFPDGRLAAGNLYWYDPDYVTDLPLFDEPREWGSIEKQRKWVTRRLAKLPYRRDLEQLLIRYAGALDQPNSNLAFLQMWGILEKLTDTIGSNYDETIRRATWVFEDTSRPIAKEMLQSLRYRRNQYVHSGTGGQQPDQFAYLLKSFVDPHLVKLLHNPYRVRSLEEYGQVLALPTDAAVLKDRMQKLRLALRTKNRPTGTR